MMMMRDEEERNMAAVSLKAPLKQNKVTLGSETVLLNKPLKVTEVLINQGIQTFYHMSQNHQAAEPKNVHFFYR